MKSVYGGDLETDHDGKRAWIVQFAISDGEKEITGTDLNGFNRALLDLMRSGESYLYFHNLKYDLEFFKYGIKELCEVHGFELQIMMREKNPIFIKIVPEKGSKLKPVHIRDSMKKIPGSLSNMAKLVGMKKLDGFDFVPGWSNSVDLTNQANWDYVKMDARIVAVAMQEMHNLGNDRSTFSGDAWNTAKTMLGSDANGDRYPQNLKWERYFPQIDIKLDGNIRPAYFGGINISRHRGITTGEITHADVNSMYPSVMYYDPLPHGLPTYTEHEPVKGSLYVVKGMFRLNLKPGLIPWFMFKSAVDNHMEGMEAGVPVEHTEHFHLLTLTSIDLELLNEWYDVEWKPDYPPEYWVFKSRTGIFRAYIDHFTKIKQESEKGSMRYHWAKFMLNSLYGRFGLNPNGQETELVISGEDLIWKETAVVNEEMDAYLPYAMFITAHARRRLLSYIKKCGPDKVIHSDTDSVIHTGGLVEGVEYGKELGKWGLEHPPLKIFEGGFKRYVKVISSDVRTAKAFSIASAGIPKRTVLEKVPVGMWVEIIDNPEKILTDDTLGMKDYRIKSQWLRDLYQEHGIDPDCVNTMKLIPVRVPGGVILEERQHKLKDGLVYRLR